MKYKDATKGRATTNNRLSSISINVYLITVLVYVKIFNQNPPLGVDKYSKENQIPVTLIQTSDSMTATALLSVSRKLDAVSIFGISVYPLGQGFLQCGT